jgi:hypothetical protein
MVEGIDEVSGLTKLNIKQVCWKARSGGDSGLSDTIFILLYLLREGLKIQLSRNRKQFSLLTVLLN